MNLRVVFVMLSLVLLAMAALACGGGSSPAKSTEAPKATQTRPPFSTPAITPPAELVPNTLEDAVRLTASVYTGHGSNLSSARPDSVMYVETTAGRADAFFQPNRQNFEGVPDDAPAWAFVAHGEFIQSTVGTGGTPGRNSTAWIVILKGVFSSTSSAYNDQNYDLSTLGNVMELPASAYSDY